MTPEKSINQLSDNSDYKMFHIPALTESVVIRVRPKGVAPNCELPTIQTGVAGVLSNTESTMPDVSLRATRRVELRNANTGCSRATVCGVRLITVESATNMVEASVFRYSTSFVDVPAANRMVPSISVHRSIAKTDRPLNKLLLSCCTTTNDVLRFAR